jgi:hypothetical protein
MDMSALGGQPSGLRTLSVRRRPRTTVNGIGRWSGLENLEISFENTVSDLRPVGMILSLKVLRIVVVRGIAVKIDLTPVLGLRNLEEIHVSCTALNFQDSCS